MKNIREVNQKGCYNENGNDKRQYNIEKIIFVETGWTKMDITKGEICG